MESKLIPMSEPKFYTPTIEDLHVGLECEVWCHQWPNSWHWKEMLLDAYHIELIKKNPEKHLKETRINIKEDGE